MSNSKPEYMSMKDWLVATKSKEHGIDEELYDKVITWSYIKAKAATETCRSVELSGFGTMVVSPVKLKRRLNKQDAAIYRLTSALELNPTLSQKSRESIEKKLLTAIKNFEYLKNKTPDENRMEGDTGRLEK